MADFADVDGTDEVQAALRGAPEAIRNEFLVAMQDQARMIVGAAEGHVPRLSGKARASLGVQVEDGAAMIVAGGRTAPYFNIIEYGSKFVRGGHHVGRAIDAAMTDIEAAAATGAQRGIDKVGL